MGKTATGPGRWTQMESDPITGGLKNVPLVGYVFGTRADTIPKSTWDSWKRVGGITTGGKDIRTGLNQPLNPAWQNKGAIRDVLVTGGQRPTFTPTPRDKVMINQRPIPSSPQSIRDVLVTGGQRPTFTPTPKPPVKKKPLYIDPTRTQGRQPFRGM